MAYMSVVLAVFSGQLHLILGNSEKFPTLFLGS